MAKKALWIKFNQLTQNGTRGQRLRRTLDAGLWPDDRVSEGSGPRASPERPVPYHHGGWHNGPVRPSGGDARHALALAGARRSL